MWSFLHLDEQRKGSWSRASSCYETTDQEQYQRCVYSQCTTLSESHACHVLTKKSGDLTGPLAWSGGGDGTLLVHELLTGQCLYALGATANGAVRCISLVGPDRLVVAGDDGNVMIYSI